LQSSIINFFLIFFQFISTHLFFKLQIDCNSFPLHLTSFYFKFTSVFFFSFSFLLGWAFLFLTFMGIFLNITFHVWL
jgi:hypothetical protein